MEHTYRSCSFTGHRRISAEHIRKICLTLRPLLITLVNNGCTDFYAGGALGFDTLAALEVLRLRTEFPQIKLHLILPNSEQTAEWKDQDVETYEFIKEQANSFIYLDMEYSTESLHRRNRELVDRCDILVCFKLSGRSGTASTVRYAASKGREVINIAELETYAENDKTN